MVVYRPTGSGPTIYIKEAATGCGSPTYAFDVPGATARSAVAAVRDISGDTRGDFVVIDPETFTWRRFFSARYPPAHTTYYEVFPTVQLGGRGAMPL